MNTLRRDPETRKNYAYEAVSALALYCKRAREANPQLEAAAMDDMMMMEYDEWSSQIDTISEAIRTRSSEPAIPDSEMEERDRRARATGFHSSKQLKMRRRQEHEEFKRRRTRRKGNLRQILNLQNLQSSS